MGLSARGMAEMEIDWGDNSKPDHPYFKDPKQLFHTFDNTITGVRRIKLYGDPAVRSLDLTQMHPAAIYLYRPFPVEEFTPAKRPDGYRLCFPVGKRADHRPAGERCRAAYCRLWTARR